MMSQLCIRLLGPLQVSLDGTLITQFETEKSRMLLAYLAAEADRQHHRAFLAEMLWPERSKGLARANLRHTLAGLRQALNDSSNPAEANAQARPPFLLTDRQSIQFNRDSNTWVDVWTFSHLLQTPDTEDQSTFAALEEAVDLYRGSFIEDVLVTDSNLIEEWLLLTREHLKRLASDALRRLAEWNEQCGEYERALQHVNRQVEIEPWDERAQRQVMRLLAYTGQRNAALAQYEVCCHLLMQELGVEPEVETVELNRRIRDELLAIPAPHHRLPVFMHKSAREVAPPVFVAREQELARLFTFLDRALAGQGYVAFITGGPGQGKTALLGEFARRALDAHPHLLLTTGNSSAISGIGDPYQPFRQVMSMLTGDLEGHWSAGSISRSHARRLWSALPIVMPALLENGSSLIDTIVPGEALLRRTMCVLMDRPGWTELIRALNTHLNTRREDLDQSFLFKQYADVLTAIASRRPLVMILDDIQWADKASVGLLFYLVRRIAAAGNPIFILCAYRPEEVVLDRDNNPHPLAMVLNEFKRTFGDVWVDLDALDESENRQFVDAFLDTERNRLSDEFRSTLFRRTGGHPLFTVELLRVLHERGEIVPDMHADGAWIEGPALNWDTLPTRVEAVIELRVNRLNPELKEIISVASVEGEQFTAQVVAAALDMEERSLLQSLQKLEKLYRLIREVGDVRTDDLRGARYQFRHILVQQYVYRQLCSGERRLLHGEVAVALARLYQDQQEGLAAQLAQHFYKAEIYDQAFHYASIAAKRATNACAYQNAISLYTSAIELAQKLNLNSVTLIDLLHDRGKAYAIAGDFELARADHEAALEISQTAGLFHKEWRALLDLAELWSSQDYDRSLEYIDLAQDIAYRMDEPAALAGSLNWIGNWHTNAENPVKALDYHRQALDIYQRLEANKELAQTLDLLGLTSLIGGELSTSVQYYNRAISLFREQKDRLGLTASLTGRGLARAGTGVNLTTPAPSGSVDALCDLYEALQIAQEIDSPSAKAWALWALSLLKRGHGLFGEALEHIQDSLLIATSIGHREWMAGSRSIMGELYTEMLAPEEALPHLEQALILSQKLRSQHWFHQTAEALAATWRMLGDPVQALGYLTQAISQTTAMDTLHKRMCWARRAELALDQGDPSLALNIVNRLLASIPDQSPGRATPFLLLLKGDALAAKSREKEAYLLLRAALDDAQAPAQRLLRWRIHARLGRLNDDMHHQVEAEHHFAAAHLLVEELAQTIPDATLRNNFLNRAFTLL